MQIGAAISAFFAREIAMQHRHKRRRKRFHVEPQRTQRYTFSFYYSSVTIYDSKETIYYLPDMHQYQDLLKHILDKGTEHQDRTGVGTISTFGYQTRFDLREGFPIVTTKRVPFRWVAEELFWFLSGSTSDVDLQARGVDIWAEWATEEQTARFGREAGDLGPVYGYLWRSFGGDYPQMNGVEFYFGLMWPL